MDTRNVVSLDLAKRLKAAKFPQEAAFSWHPRPLNKPEYSFELVQAWRSEPLSAGYAAPTAQELADWLPRHAYSQLTVRLAQNADRWVASGSDATSDGPTIANALAGLALKLVETGELSFNGRSE